MGNRGVTRGLCLKGRESTIAWGEECKIRLIGHLFNADVSDSPRQLADGQIMCLKVLEGGLSTNKASK
jgi:hypothetical protein